MGRACSGAGGVKPFQVIRLKNPASGGDPLFSSVGSLLHFDGSNGSSTFTDQIGIPWTANGGAVLSTTQAKFGASSFGVINGAYIETPINALITFTNQPWTVECFLWVPSAFVTQWVFFFVVVGSGLKLSLNSSNFLQAEATSVGEVATSATSFPRDQWVHVAVTRGSSNNWNIWQAGVSVASATYASATSDGDTRIGNTPNGNGLYLDEFRYTRGVDRYTGTFTPPASAFPDA